jgi:hypothetical protein
VKHPMTLLVALLCVGLGVLALHADPSSKTKRKHTSHMPYRYTSAELAEEAIEAYQALGTNDVALAKTILLNAIVNYIEDDQRGGSAVTSEVKIDQKENRVREEFRKIYSDLMKPKG